MSGKSYLLERYTATGQEPDQEISEARIREEVMRLVAWGIEPATIATLMRMPLATLEKEYEDELKNGATVLLARAAGRVYEIGMESRDHRAALTALLAILKHKGGWREPTREANPQLTVNAQAVQFVLPRQLSEQDWASATEQLRQKFGKGVDEASLLIEGESKVVDNQPVMGPKITVDKS